MSLPYSFASRLIVRTPSLPLHPSAHDIDTAALLQDANFMEALYLASNVLYEECIKWRNGQITAKKDVDKLMRSINKYFLRMSSRCTPFGLFSGCSVAGWNPGQTSIVLDSRQTDRHTRLDMQYLCALAEHLSGLTSIRNRILFFPNNSLYRIGKELRYVEYSYTDSVRNYHISSVTVNDYLLNITRLAEQGATICQLKNFLTRDDIPAPEAEEYIEKLIGSQLLVSEMQPAITGKEFMQQLISSLQRIASEDAPEILAILRTLNIVRDLLKQLDEGCHQDISLYRAIMQHLDTLGVEYNEGRLFQTDVVRSLSGGLSSAVQQELTAALAALNRLTPPKGSEALRSFTSRFTQRYGDKEMPLLEVLDTETGIGYQETNSSGICPLVCDLQISSATPEQRLGWGKIEVLLNEKLRVAREQSTGAISLTDEDLRDLSPAADELPPSMSVMFRCIDDENIYLENAGGSSAVNLLGRFAHADPAIHELASDIARQEQALDQDVIYAEIVHLPEARTGNILLHPAFRAYEIPYLAQSSLDKECQLDLQDLCVSIRKGRVVLRSQRLNKTIVPRLSTAHNYSLSSLPVYRFLCDLQAQGKKNALRFNWGSLRHQHCHLPRVMYRRTILSAASWNFSAGDIDCLKRTATTGELNDQVAAFRTKWGLPAEIILCDGDNELPVNLDNTNMVQLLLDSVKNRDQFLIREFIRPGLITQDENGNPYANQFIAVLTRNNTTAPAQAHAPRRHPSQLAEPAQTPEPGVFALGSEWLYFKLYCGVKSADMILCDAIAPITRELHEYGLIDKWFFIRYNDPEFHLRVRFHLNDTRRIGDVILLIHSHLQPFIDDGYLWKTQTETYTRELQRYGTLATGMAESLFHLDSECLLQMLDKTPDHNREAIRWMWALPAIDRFLDCFDLSADDKLTLLQQLRDSFAAEFNMDKPLKTQLNDKYRVNKQMIESIMQHGDIPAEWNPLIAILDERSAAVRPVAARINDLFAAGKMEISLFSLLGSYIHMMVNRIVISEARIHEAVIYDFLCRCYKSRSYLQSGDLCNRI